MLYLIVYLYDNYGRFLNLIIATAIFSAIVVAYSLIAMGFNSEYRDYGGDERNLRSWRRTYEVASKTFKRFAKIGIVSLLMFTVLPSKQGLAMLGGVYVGTQVFDKLEHSTLVDKSVKILNVELDRYLNRALESRGVAPADRATQSKPEKQEK